MARGRGRGRGRGAGRGKKAVRVLSSDEEQVSSQTENKETTESVAEENKNSNNMEDEQNVANTTEKMNVDESNTEQTTNANVNDEKNVGSEENKIDEEVKVPTIDMEADISQLEAPTFTTISRGPPEPMLHLDWNHKVNLIGEKVINPMIHCCDQCEKPILIYGRMIPCKHVFCLGCARKETMKVCPRCKEKAIRVEQTGLGTVFMCTHGGTRYESKGCRRTYLSQRDLQAHINHRHINTPIVPRLESLAVKLNDNDGAASQMLLSPQKKTETSRQTQKINSSPGGNTNMYNASSQHSANRGSGYFSPFSGYSGSNSGTGASEQQSWNQGQYYR